MNVESLSSTLARRQHRDNQPSANRVMASPRRDGLTEEARSRRSATGHVARGLATITGAKAIGDIFTTDANAANKRAAIVIPEQIRIRSAQDLRNAVENGDIENAELIHPSFTENDPSFTKAINTFWQQFILAKSSGVLNNSDLSLMLRNSAYIGNSTLRGINSKFSSISVINADQLRTIHNNAFERGIGNESNRREMLASVRRFLNEVVDTTVYPNMREEGEAFYKRKEKLDANSVLDASTLKGIDTEVRSNYLPRYRRAMIDLVLPRPGVVLSKNQ